MTHVVKFHPDFVPEWKKLDSGLKELVGEVLDHIEDDGPFLGRPEVDRLEGSVHANMKEIRVSFGKELWRFAFAFDPGQSAVILCGKAKQGMNQGLFYRQLLARADRRFASWLLENEK